MSTVDRKTAERVMAGEPSEGVHAIIEYANIFDGGLAYKLVYPRERVEDMIERLACRGCRVIWRRGEAAEDGGSVT